MNKIQKHNWENILKKKDKNLPDSGSETVTNFPGSIFEPVAGYHAQPQALNPTAGTSRPSRSRVWLNHSVKGVLQGVLQCGSALSEWTAGIVNGQRTRTAALPYNTPFTEWFSLTAMNIGKSQNGEATGSK